MDVQLDLGVPTSLIFHRFPRGYTMSSLPQLTHFVAGKPVPGTSGRFADVYDPTQGKPVRQVPLADVSEVEAAISNAAEAQPGWAARNPQQRARVLAKFVDLVRAEIDDLAAMLSQEHGKTLADAKGDIERGLEVCEFATGIPHLIKGEYTSGAGTGIDV